MTNDNLTHKTRLIFLLARFVSTNAPSNYQHISLLPLFGKFLEALINADLIKHLSSQGLFFSYKKYGLYFSRSTAYVLMIIVKRVYHALNKNGEALAVALNIAKAFDRI